MLKRLAGVAAGVFALAAAWGNPAGAQMSLKFTNVPGTPSCGGAGLSPAPSAPFTGALFSNTACSTKTNDLGRGCLYIGGGNAKAIPPGGVPSGATNYLNVSGANLVASAGTGTLDCTKAAGPTKVCLNNDALPACTSDADCGGYTNGCHEKANCFFGPPLEFPNPILTSLTTCVQNVLQADASGTGDASTGASNVTMPLSSWVYVTGNLSSPCPHCCTPTSATFPKCTGAKLKVSGKAASGELKCDSKAEAKGDASGVTACEVKPDTALTNGFTKANGKGPCPGTASSVQTALDSFESAAISAVGASQGSPTASKCDSKKVAAMGKKASSVLGCNAKGASKSDPSIVGPCVSTAETKFDGAITKAESSGDCTSSGQTGAGLEPTVDNYVNAVLAAVPAATGAASCTGTCSYGVAAGGACSTTSSSGSSQDCAPTRGGGAFQAPLSVTLSPLTTGTTSLTSASGNFCPSQKTAGAFAVTTSQCIQTVGNPAGDLTDGAPHAGAILASAFCIPTTTNSTIDGVADLPGPGLTSLPGTAQIVPTP